MISNMDWWKDIEGYKGLYEVSKNGLVRSVRNNIILKISKNRDGYNKVTLCSEGHRKTICIHRVVCVAFIKNPLMKKTVNHKDGVKTNNSVDNLEWATSKENNQHAWDTGLIKKECHKGESNPKSKLTRSDIDEIRAIGRGAYQYILAERYGVSTANISLILANKTWQT